MKIAFIGGGSMQWTALLTIDELSSAVGLTVRTTRYYASLGLIPAPIRQGRVACYDETEKQIAELAPEPGR